MKMTGKAEAMVDERPTQRDVECALEPALFKHAATTAIYGSFRDMDGQALALLRAMQMFPAHTTVDQIQAAILRRSQAPVARGVAS